MTIEIAYTLYMKHSLHL